MSKHTQRWRYRGTLGPPSNPHFEGPYVIENEEGVQIASVNGGRNEVSKANARLLADAPRMYDENAVLLEALRDIANIACAAIAKAERKA
jgi:hypothetical protein